jgi:hypothetical protein
MATLLHRSQQLHEAARHYNEAILLKPDFALCYTNLGSTPTPAAPRMPAGKKRKRFCGASRPCAAGPG